MNEGREDIVKWCAGALYAGAADTVRLILLSLPSILFSPSLLWIVRR